MLSVLSKILILQFFVKLKFSPRAWNVKLKNTSINNLKILVANEATKILHGEKKSKESEGTAKETFAGSGIGQNLPVILIKKSILRNGINIIDFINNTKILNSKSEIRRAINEKGIKINDTIVTDNRKNISISDLNNDYIKVSYGKKKHYKIKLN